MSQRLGKVSGISRQIMMTCTAGPYPWPRLPSLAPPPPGKQAAFHEPVCACVSHTLHLLCLGVAHDLLSTNNTFEHDTQGPTELASHRLLDRHAGSEELRSRPTSLYGQPLPRQKTPPLGGLGLLELPYLLPYCRWLSCEAPSCHRKSKEVMKLPCHHECSYPCPRRRPLLPRRQRWQAYSASGLFLEADPHLGTETAF